MADYQSARAAGIAAVDELDGWQGQPKLSAQLASVTTLQQQNATLTADLQTRTTERDTEKTRADKLQQAVTAMKAAAKADLDADAANEAGKGVLDAAAAAGV